MQLALRPRESRVSRFRGSPDAELLAAESDGVLRVLELALQRLLELTPATGEALNPRVGIARAAPVLTLRLFPRAEQREMSDTERSQALSAFALLAAHSRRVSTFPELKRAFWLDVLRSRMLYETTRNVPKTALREPAFPLFVVDFRDHTFYGHDATPPPFALPEDVLVSFLTTTPPSASPPTLPDATVGRPDAVTFELSFAGCRLTSVDALEAVERALDCAFAHPMRQFAVSALDLSGSRMSSSELAVVARIAHKCRYVYHVSELRLNEIIPGVVGFGYQCQDTTPREFLDIMRSVYGFSHPPVLPPAAAVSSSPATPSAKDIVTAPSTLRSVSLSGNYVCPTYFAALFSALRYGSPVEEDFSQYVPKPTKGSPEKAECWGWLAFGLFYPRPTRFAKMLELRNIGRLECTSEVVEALTKTLHNPAVQLAYRGAGTNAAAAASELLVCTVKKGASVELITFDPPRRSFFGSIAPAQPAPTQPERREIDAQCELEGVCERESDGAVCVVIPGVGLGWVQRDAVERIERESLESAWKHQDGRYAVQLACGYSRENRETMSAVLALLGRQIRSLSFDCYRLDLSIVPQILQHCPNLQHLSLQSINLPDSDVDALLGALRASPLRTQLLTLNLNDSSFVRDAAVQKLAAVLACESSSDNRLALRELRLHGAILGIDTVTALSNALSSNRDLGLLQLLRVSGLRNRDLSAEQKLLSEMHDYQVLQSALPIKSKLAFLSVVGHEKSAAVHRMLDSNLVALIFRFAHGRDVRRVIAWTSDIRCGGY